MSSSGGKLLAHGPRRIIVPARHACDTFLYPISSIGFQYDAVDNDNVRAKFYSFGHSLKKTGTTFIGAASARQLHLCDMHWFLFGVDKKHRMLVYLDSLHQEGDKYFEPIISLLLKNLHTVWDKYHCTPMDFSSSKTKFPPVRQQEYSFDSGVYVMMFMEICSPRIILSNEFSSENIKNIRVQYTNHLFFGPKNKMLQTEVEDVVPNWFDPKPLCGNPAFRVEQEGCM
uniref:Ubiquitin-like protease family profile domain-containing protein n=1 Tax=Oryza punctata TaxID=4537 RepID=A0A0E0LJ67_ORYPU